MKHLGDITKIDGYSAPIVDCITFGAPCQDLSVAGKRKGMLHESRGDEETSRSGLFHEAIRIIKEMRENDRLERLRSGRSDVNIRPRYAIYENVPGAFSSNKGEDFRVVLEEVARISEESVTIPRPEKGRWSNAGAIVGEGWSIAWRVFDAQFWGVPQRRRRICLVADFNGLSAPEILFNEAQQYGSTKHRDTDTSVGYFGEDSKCKVQSISEGLSRDSEPSREKGEDIAEDAQGSIGTGYPAYTYQDREGCAGGGKGGLIQEDKATSLRTNNYMTVFQPTVVVSMDRESFNAGSEFNKAMVIHEDGIQPTLVAKGPGAVCYEDKVGGVTDKMIYSIGHDIRSARITEDGITDPLTATDYKEPTLVVYKES